MLGNCPEYHLYFTKRGGEVSIGTSPFSALYFNRTLDAISSATIIAAPHTKAAQEVIKQLNPWEHEVVIIRGNTPVWQGPISDEINYTNGDDGHKVVLTCQDILAWFEHRRVGITKDYVEEDVGVIYQDLVVDAMAKDPTPNISVDLVKTNVYTTRSYDVVRRQVSWNALAELHKTGMDVTTVGRQILVGAQEIPIQALGTLPMGTYKGLNIRRRGSDMMNDVTATGSGSFGGEVTTGNYSSLVYAPENVEQFGLLEGQTANYMLTTIAAAEEAAKTRWEFTRAPGTYVQMTLLPKAPAALDTLIPGALVNLHDNSTLFTLDGQFRMSRLDCQVVAGAEGSVAEVVSPIWATAGTFTEAI